MFDSSLTPAPQAGEGVWLLVGLMGGPIGAAAGSFPLPFPRAKFWLRTQAKFFLVIFNLNGTVAIYNSTLARNVTRPGLQISDVGLPTLTQGGAVYNLAFGPSLLPAALTLGNSILANSDSDLELVNDNQQGQTPATVASRGPSLVYSCDFCDSAAQVNSLQFVVRVDPLLGPLVKTTGPSAALLPDPMSQVVGRGNPDLCTGSTVGSVDQLGQPRPPDLHPGGRGSQSPGRRGRQRLPAQRQTVASGELPICAGYAGPRSAKEGYCVFSLAYARGADRNSSTAVRTWSGASSWG